MSWCDEHGTDGGCSECADEYWKKEMRKLEQENERLRDFKEFVNMMIRRSLNHTCSDYEALMAIDEKLTKEKGNES